MSDPTQSTPEQNPYTKPGFIISAALVIALIAAVIVIFLIPKGNSDAQPAPSQSEGNTSAPAPATNAPEASVCGLPPSSETALGAAPKSKWTLVGKMAAPNDPETFGPGITDSDGIRSCFAHSPTGALYSAANIVALGSSKEHDEVKLGEKLLVPGPGRDAAIKEAQARAQSSSGTAESAQLRGFVIRSYSTTEADVDLAVELPNGALFHSVVSLRWTDGDWKIKAADDGEIFTGMAQLSDLSGFIAWSGV